jgi:repressor of nif and glnA expression
MGTRDHILAIIAASDTAMSAKDIADILGNTTNVVVHTIGKVNYHLLGLRADGLITQEFESRTIKHRQYLVRVFCITSQGTLAAANIKSE